MVLLLFVIGLGGAVCVILKTEELTDTILSNIIGVLAFLSGMFFSVDSLGSVASIVSNISPLKWILDLTFNIIYDNDFENYNIVFIGLILLSILGLVIMHINYKPEDYI